jgi:hypothetical protein
VADAVDDRAGQHLFRHRLADGNLMKSTTPGPVMIGFFAILILLFVLQDAGDPGIGGEGPAE